VQIGSRLAALHNPAYFSTRLSYLPEMSGRGNRSSLILSYTARTSNASGKKKKKKKHKKKKKKQASAELSICL